VVAERNGGSESASRRLSLPAAAEAAGLARRATREAVLSQGIAHLQETAVLLVSELVTNAVSHLRTGTRPMVLRLEAAQSTPWIEVEDADPRWPQPRRPVGLHETGFGFVLTRALARKWGARDTAAGKAIWAELATSPGGAAITTSDDGLSQAPQRRTSWCAPR
jgi:serine/threonine-protein kinase RsbW